MFVRTSTLLVTTLYCLHSYARTFTLLVTTLVYCLYSYARTFILLVTTLVYCLHYVRTSTLLVTTRTQIYTACIYTAAYSTTSTPLATTLHPLHTGGRTSTGLVTTSQWLIYRMCTGCTAHVSRNACGSGVDGEGDVMDCGSKTCAEQHRQIWAVLLYFI